MMSVFARLHFDVDHLERTVDLTVQEAPGTSVKFALICQRRRGAGCKVDTSNHSSRLDHGVIGSHTLLRLALLCLVCATILSEAFEGHSDTLSFLA